LCADPAGAGPHARSKYDDYGMKIEEYVGKIGGIAEYSQLRASGFTTAAAQYAVRVGRLARIRRGWVATPDAPESSVRAVRVGGSLTCVSVLTERGVWCVDDELLHVRVNRHANHLASPESRSVALGDPAMQGVAVHGTFAAYRSPRYCHTDPVDVAVMHELDGREWHSSPEAFAEDRRRDLILHERGYFVVRLTYAQVMFEWPRVEGMIRELVVRHKHLWPRSVGAANSTSVGAQPHRLR
jgi:hypothetical protein